MVTHAKRPPLITAAVASALFVVMAMLVLAACGNSGPAASTSPVAVASPSGTATPLPAPTVAGTLGFVRITDGLWFDVYAIEAGGSGLTALAADHDLAETDMAWSPDGNRIVYVKADTEDLTPGEHYKLWLMDADGSAQKRLLPGGVAGTDPEWSPDGRKIVFSKWMPGDDYKLATVNADGSGLAALDGTAGGRFPTWAGGDTIYFLSPVRGSVLSIRPDGSGLTRAARLSRVAGYGLSPDGMTLAVYQMWPLDRIVLVPASGGAPPAVIVKPMPEAEWGKVIAISWSPDGKAIAFANSSLDGPPGSSVFVVNADGSGLSAVPNTGPAYGVDWRPR